MYGGLGGVTDRIGESVDAARAYLRDRWNAFLALERGILDMQHRAAQAAYHAQQAADLETAELARQTIRKLGELGKKHVRAVDTMRDVSRWVGLSGYQGLGLAIPAAQVTVITSLALLVAWFFRAYEAEERKLDMIERGVLTPQEAANLDAGPAPLAMLGAVGGIGKLALGALALFALVRLAETATAWKPNPALEVWRENPPVDFGRQVFAVWYRHAEDGEDYVHEFGRGVTMHAEPDGTVALRHRWGRPLWRDFS